MSKKLLSLLGLVAIIFSTFAYSGSARAGGSGTISLVSGSGSYFVGSTFTLDIHENSGLENVNSVQADFIYDQSRLQYVTSNIAGGAFPLGPQTSGGNGSASVVGGSILSHTGDQLVGTITFKVLASAASSNIALANSSLILRSNDSANIWNGVTTGSSYALSTNNQGGLPVKNTVALPGNFSGDGKQDFAYITQRPDGGSDIAVWQSNGASGMSWQGVWLAAPSINFSSAVFVPTDFDGDGRTDLYYATPHGNGFDMALLRNTGTGFSYVGQQWNPTSLSLSDTKFIAGNFSGDAKGDFIYATRRSDGGTDLAEWQSNGTAGMTWQGVWQALPAANFDNAVFVPADYDGDGRTDLYYATVHSGGGFDMALLRSTGTGLSYVGQQWNPSWLNLTATRFIAGNFSGDSKQEFAYITRRADGGSDIGVWQSNGVSGLSWQGIWQSAANINLDTSAFIPADYDGNGLTDIYYATANNPGFDMALLSSSGTSFDYVGRQWTNSSLNMNTTKFIPKS